MRIELLRRSDGVGGALAARVRLRIVSARTDDLDSPWSYAAKWRIASTWRSLSAEDAYSSRSNSSPTCRSAPVQVWSAPRLESPIARADGARAEVRIAGPFQ